MIADDKVTEFFCAVDEFCKYFTPELKKHQLPEPGRCRRNRKCNLSDSEVMSDTCGSCAMYRRDKKEVV